MTDELIVSLLQDFNGRLGMFEEEIAPVEFTSEDSTHEITLYVTPDGKRDYCDDGVAFRSDVLWQKTLKLSTVEFAVFVARWESMEVIEQSFIYGADSTREQSLQSSGISVTNSSTKGYSLVSSTGYLITTSDYLWEAKYLRLLLCHPSIWDANTQKFNLSKLSFVNLLSTVKCCSFPIVRMYPISYRNF